MMLTVERTARSAVVSAAIWLVVRAAIWAVVALAHSAVEVAVNVLEETVDMVRCLGRRAEVEADVEDHITTSSSGGIDTDPLN
jgi:histone H3/H4